MSVPSALFESLSLVAVTGSPGFALPASTGLASVALISEPPAALASARRVLAEAAPALPLAALALLRLALTSVPDVPEALPCTGAPSANAYGAIASNDQKHNF